MGTKQVIERRGKPKRVYSRHEEDPRLLQMTNTMLKYRRGYITRVPKEESVVMAMSGGLDSSVTVDIVIPEWNVTIYPLFVRRSARATKYEEEAARYFVDFYDQRYPGKIKPLEVVETEVPPLQFKKYPEVDRLQRLGHPHRNSMLQALCVQYGQKLRATKAPDLSTVLTSTVEDDSFPHSSLLALRTMTLLTCEDTGDWNWQVISPLIDTEFKGRPIYKKDLIKHAVKNGIPLEKTRTCIEGGEPDGTCAECACRLRAFKKAGVKDPIIYK
ncbi:7-cyano-7-deazaguanine synthase [Candidatus Woesebacteria bacterium]|nr:7-cyano-7-deazaguanine synthase [Candidatus Woesebacteria bacterium]